MQNKRLIIIVLISASLLLIPLITMQFTDEVNWILSDFVIAGALLLGTGLMIEACAKKDKENQVPNRYLCNSTDNPPAYLGRNSSWHFWDTVQRTIDSNLKK